jgi:hypothetical protein
VRFPVACLVVVLAAVFSQACSPAPLSVSVQVAAPAAPSPRQAAPLVEAPPVPDASRASPLVIRGSALEALDDHELARRLGPKAIADEAAFEAPADIEAVEGIADALEALARRLVVDGE